MERQRSFPKANARAKRLRVDPTSAEARLWKLLRRLDGFHFRRQAAVGPHVFDFADLSRRLLIEVDGGIHDLPEVRKRDNAKESWAVSRGVLVVRIPNNYVFGTGEPAIALLLSEVRRHATASKR